MTPIKTAASALTSVVLPAHDLATLTYECSAHLYATVAAAYLTFRHTYYDEERPSLATIPRFHTGVQQKPIAQIADNLLRMFPKGVTALPMLGGFLTHLQQVANIHSLSEHERTALHNLAMLYLHGVKGGIQPWYCQWVLASARNLRDVAHPQQFMDFPWEALLYLEPAALTRFHVAVQKNDIALIEQEMTILAERLIAALRDPIGVQAALAFTGPQGKEHEEAFRLKTNAALALGALLVIGEVQTLFSQRGAPEPPHSLLAPFPSALLIEPATEQQYGTFERTPTG